jgi:hypothetical protein
MVWQKKYRWSRTWPDDRDRHGNVPEDYVGFDGEVNIGRIYLDDQTLKAGQWRWAGQYPTGCRTWIMPNNGWMPTASDAARVVEEYWDAMLRRRDEEIAPVPSYVEQFKGYRISIYSPNDHYAVITPPGSNAALDFGERRPQASVVEGLEACLGRARASIEALTAPFQNVR